MSRGLVGEDDEVSGSDDDNDDLFDEDMEALRRACLLTGTDISAADAATTTSDRGASVSDSNIEIDDLELVRSIQNRFLTPLISLNPPASRHPATSDDEEDDFETLRAIQKRFSAYDHDSVEKRENGYSLKSMVSNLSGITVEKESVSKISINESDACEIFPPTEVACGSTHLLNENNENDFPGYMERHELDAQRPSTETLNSHSFPKCAQVFIDAIKKNRSCQKLLRSKLIQIEARIEEIKKVKERVQILKDFQVSCRRRTERALSQRKNDPRIQLISLDGTLKKSNANDKKVAATSYGPAENADIPNYRLALTKFPLSIHRKKWSDEEKDNLRKGVKQQFQEMVFRISVDRFSNSDGDSGSFEDTLASIKTMEISPERIREFLPKVNWGQLASMYVCGRSGSECEGRWLNWEDPLINHAPWTTEEDKHLLFVIQEKGINNWFDIAVSLGTERTPFQCLARYQRSLNPCIMRREWTKEEDAQLRIAVETYGEGNWQDVASALEGRTGTQCSNRWLKSLHPQRQRVGRWSEDEDKKLTVAVMLFGPKNWRKIAQFVPGRTFVQCRERWVNSLDPALNRGEWTAEEDERLEAAIAEHGYCWSKIASCVPPRTDNQCLRRWKVLFPHQVPLLQAIRKIQRVALVSNFVDRESERPSLGPKDFAPLQITYPGYESGSIKPPNEKVVRSRKRRQPEERDDSCVRNKVVSKRRKKGADDNAGGNSCPDRPSKKAQSERQKRGADDNTVANPCPDKHVKKVWSKRLREGADDYAVANSFPDQPVKKVQSKRRRKIADDHTLANPCPDKPVEKVQSKKGRKGALNDTVANSCPNKPAEKQARQEEPKDNSGPGEPKERDSGRVESKEKDADAEESMEKDIGLEASQEGGTVAERLEVKNADEENTDKNSCHAESKENDDRRGGCEETDTAVPDQPRHKESFGRSKEKETGSEDSQENNTDPYQCKERATGSEEPKEGDPGPEETMEKDPDLENSQEKGNDPEETQEKLPASGEPKERDSVREESEEIDVSPAESKEKSGGSEYPEENGPGSEELEEKTIDIEGPKAQDADILQDDAGDCTLSVFLEKLKKRKKNRLSGATSIRSGK